MNQAYDAIVVGARCAGSPTAMLLARQGYRVLVVDRASFPSDTAVDARDPRPGGGGAAPVGAARRRSIASGCPPIETYSFDFGPFTITGTPRPEDGISTGLRAAAHRARHDPRRRRRRRRRRGPRAVHASTRSWSRTARSSASAATATTAQSVVERARGRDRRRRPELARRQGRRARAVPREADAAVERTTPTGATCPSTASRSSSDPTGAGRRSPTNDGLTMLVVGWPYAESAAYKADVEGNYLKTLELAPEFADRVRGRDPRGAVHRRRRCPTSSASRTARAGRSSATPATPRTRSPRRGSATPSTTPSGAPTALDETFAGGRPFDDGDGRLPADARRPRPADLRVHDPAGDAGAAAARDAAAARAPMHGNQRRHGRLRQRHRRHRVPAEFFDPDNIGRIMSAAAAPVGVG